MIKGTTKDRGMRFAASFPGPISFGAFLWRFLMVLVLVLSFDVFFWRSLLTLFLAFFFVLGVRVLCCCSVVLLCSCEVMHYCIIRVNTDAIRLLILFIFRSPFLYRITVS